MHDIGREVRDIARSTQHSMSKAQCDIPPERGSARGGEISAPGAALALRSVQARGRPVVDVGVAADAGEELVGLVDLLHARGQESGRGGARDLWAGASLQRGAPPVTSATDKPPNGPLVKAESDTLRQWPSDRGQDIRCSFPSSGHGHDGDLWGWEGGGLVVGDVVGEAVVEAAEQAVEQVALGGGVPFSGFASAVVVGSCAG